MPGVARRTGCALFSSTPGPATSSWTPPPRAWSSRHFATEPLGDGTPGLARVVGRERPRFEVGGRTLSRFVGRAREVEALHALVERAEAGEAQIVGLIGEPGVGKSRLVYELTHSQRVKGCLVLEAGAVSHGTATSYLPVAGLLRSYFRIGERDTQRDIREKVTGKVLALDRALEPTIPALLALLELPVKESQWQGLEPSQRRQRTLDAVTRLLVREALVQPLLVIFEDLHWIDTETWACLDRLADSSGTAPLLLLVTYRPGHREAWMDKTNYTQLRLDPLAPESADALLDTLLGRDASLDPLKRLITGTTGGNPLFMEESVRALVETQGLAGERGAYQLTRSVEAIQVPATVQAILAARIDSLPAEDKRVLETAAVIGQTVSFTLLETVADVRGLELQQRLSHLRAAELLYETRSVPDPEYTFKHVVTHEVAYSSVRPDRRRPLHARIVEAMEALYAGRLGEHVEQLAIHALRAELREKAVHYLSQAGSKAVSRSAPHDAHAWFERALAVLGALPGSQSTLEQALAIRLELGPVQWMLGEARLTLECLREAEALAERLGDERRRGRVYAFMTNIHVLLGELDEALASGTRALAIAQNLGDLALRIVTTGFLESVHHHRGEHAKVVELARDNLAVLPADWLHEYLGSNTPPAIFDRCWLVQSLAQLGRFAEAGGDAAEAIRLAGPTRRPQPIGMAHFGATTFHVLKGDWAKARESAEDWIAAVRTGNAIIQLPIAVAVSAWILAQLGKTSESLGRLQEGEQLLERQVQRGFIGNLSPAYHALGRATLLLGRLDEVLPLASRALEFSPHHPGLAADALHLLGDLAVHPDRFDAERGETHYRHALALAEPRGMRPLVAHCHLGLGRLSQRTGRRPEADSHVALATALYREMDMTYWLEQAEAAL